MGDIVKDLREHAKKVARNPELAHFSYLEDAAAEIEDLRIKIIQLKFACGYPMPADQEHHIIPHNPFKCGVCDARSKQQ